MDLERLKQNLRLRSGRTKKPRRPAPQPQSTFQKPSLPEPATANGHVPDPPNQKPSATADNKNNPAQVGSKDVTSSKPKQTETLPPLDSVPPHRPELPHATTGLNGAVKQPGRAPRQYPDRYGRSGMERPRRSSPPAKIERRMTEPKAVSSDDTDINDYDLRPPPRKPKPPSLESLSELLFSEGHLNTIVHDPELLLRLNMFFSRYKSDLSPLLLRYLETQKALKAVEYANAVAEAVDSAPATDENSKTSRAEAAPPAATIDQAFAESSQSVFSALLAEGLPAYVTYQLVKIVTDCLTNEITGRSSPVMRDLVGGLSEIFCLTDPNQEDNPIIYASEEFYRLTGYDTNDVIGSNCRFLQGPKTKKEAPKRLREAQDKGEQVCETLLNYRRDGRAFINLLMIAPLFDDKDKLKYYIGAQVDVSALIEGGKSMDGFEKYLVRRQKEATRSRTKREVTGLEAKKRKALAQLRELSEMFDLEESAVVQSHSRSSSMTRGDDESIRSRERPRTARRVLADSSRSDDEDSENEDEDENEEDRAAWKLAQSGPSGKLPGVYQSYLLIRPAPSLRIIFVSPALRKMGSVAQSPFMAHIAAPSGTLAGLKESFEVGVPVTAKILFMANAGKNRYGTNVDKPSGKKGSKPEDEDVKTARTCWISATPLLGADDEIGVWMVVMVQKPRGTSSKPETSRKVDSKESTPQQPEPSYEANESKNDLQPTPTRISRSKARREDVPIKPRRLGSTNDVRSTPQPEPESQPSNPSLTAPEAENRGNDEQDGYEEVPKADQEVNTIAPETNMPQEQHENNDDDVFTEKHSSHNEPPSTEDPNSIAPSPPNDLDSDDHSDHDQETIKDHSPPPGPATETSGAEPNDSEPGMEFADKHSDSEDTPTRPSAHKHSSPRPSSSGGPESNSARPQGMLYMDYLRHPGSGNQKGPAGKAFSNSSDDPECAMSPYSVD